MSKKWKLEKKTGDACWSVWEGEGKIASTTITTSDMVAEYEKEKELDMRWKTLLSWLPEFKDGCECRAVFSYGDKILCRNEEYPDALVVFLEEIGFPKRGFDCNLHLFETNIGEIWFTSVGIYDKHGR